MLKNIETIRKKPKEVRDRYAFWGAFFITFVIASFWLVSVPSRLSIFTNTQVVEKEKIQGGFSRSFSSLKASLLSGIKKSEDIQIEPEIVVPNDNNDVIDFNTFFASTSTTTDNIAQEIAPVGRNILIGTSSKKSSITPVTQE
jgi:hypothetical protein